MTLKLVIIIGLIGSGKDTVMHYIHEKYNYLPISMSDLIREEARHCNLPLDRESLQKIKMSFCTMHSYNYWTKEALKKIHMMKADKVVINGVRFMDELSYLKDQVGKENVLVIGISTHSEERARRMLIRKREGDPTNIDSFIEQDVGDRKLFDTEELLKTTDIILDNSGSISELYGKVDESLQKHDY